MSRFLDRLKWKSGGLLSTPIDDFLSIGLDAKDPSIPNLPIGNNTIIPPKRSTRFADNGHYFSLASGLPSAATGVLVSCWTKVNFKSQTYPYGRGNDYPFWLIGSNWTVNCVSGNLNSTNTNIDAAYNANTGFSADAVGFGDKSYYVQQFMPEVQNLDWVWICYQVIANGANDVIIRMWLRYGLDMPLIARTENNAADCVITLASIRTATGNPTWAAGALTEIRIGDNHDFNGSVVDIARVHVEQYGSMPSDAKLTSIAKKQAADLSEWAFYPLDYDSRLTDTSGNNRTLTQSGSLSLGEEAPNTSGIAIIQAPDKVSNSAATLASTFGATPSTGNHVVIIGSSRSAGTITCSDNQSGNSYTVYTHAPASGNKAFAIIAPIIGASGTFTVTVAGLGTNANMYRMYEVSGVASIDWTLLLNTETAGLTLNAANNNDLDGTLIFLSAVPSNGAATVFNPLFGFKNIDGLDSANGFHVSKFGKGQITEVVQVPAPDVNNIAAIMLGLKPTVSSGIQTASITEASTASEAVSAQAAFAAAITEAVTAAEISSSNIVTAATITEASTASESTIGGLLSTATITETGASSESSSANVTMSASITEASTASDSSSTQVNGVSSITESASASDSQSNNIVTSAAITETASASEVSTGGLLSIGTITEAATAGETSSVALIQTASQTEAVSAAESSSVSMVGVVSITETASATSTQTNVIVTNSAIIEAGTAAESSSASIVTAASITEAATSNSTQDATITLAGISASITESGNATEQSSAQQISNANISEVSNASDASFTDNIITASITEAANATDTVNFIIKLVRRVVTGALTIREIGTNLVKRVFASNLDEREP